jgi:CRISPR-associated protein Cas1
VELASDRLGVIAKLDLIELKGKLVIPVDYKRGRPQTLADGSIDLWETDRIQLGVQIAILRDLGYRCEEAIVWYHSTRQRVRIKVDDRLLSDVEQTIVAARELARSGSLPPPLVDSPKCPRCSLVGICLPDEIRLCGASVGPASDLQPTLFEIDSPPRLSTTAVRELGHPRRLVPARDERRPLYLNSQGLWLGKSGQVLQAKKDSALIDQFRLLDISQINVFGSVQVSTAVIQAACEQEIPIAYFSMGGWFYGLTQGLELTNVFLRREQFRAADRPSLCLSFARALIAGKIRNQRVLLQRNHVEPDRVLLNMLKALQGEAERARSLESLLGIEGNAAAVYFGAFAGMLKVGREDDPAASVDPVLGAEPLPNPLADGDEPNGSAESTTNAMGFDFLHRNRRPPRDPVNSLLSLAYALLAKDLMITVRMVGFDPYIGFYHQPRFGRASLALDLMEPFRPLLADSVVLTAINTRMVTSRDFIRAGNAVALKPDARKRFFTAYEQRMDTLVTHPLFAYRVSYRRILEIQARLLARWLNGEFAEYPVFTTR